MIGNIQNRLRRSTTKDKPALMGPELGIRRMSLAEKKQQLKDSIRGIPRTYGINKTNENYTVTTNPNPSMRFPGLQSSVLTSKSAMAVHSRPGY